MHYLIISTSHIIPVALRNSGEGRGRHVHGGGPPMLQCHHPENVYHCSQLAGILCYNMLQLAVTYIYLHIGWGPVDT